MLRPSFSPFRPSPDYRQLYVADCIQDYCKYPKMVFVCAGGACYKNDAILLGRHHEAPLWGTQSNVVETVFTNDYNALSVYARCHGQYLPVPVYIITGRVFLNPPQSRRTRVTVSKSKSESVPGTRAIV